MGQFDLSGASKSFCFLMWYLKVEAYNTLFSILFKRYQVIVAFHLLDRDSRTIKFLGSLFLNFLNFCLETLVLILSIHISKLILKVFDIISIFVDSE